MDQLVSLGIGPPGERGSIYRRWLDLIGETESEDGGIRKGWPAPTIDKFRRVYTAFLKTYPWFTGYWIRYAQTEFRLGFTQNAITVYTRGLNELPYCVDLWASYLQFLVLVSNEAAVIEKAIDQALVNIGDDFYAHKVYDIYLEYLESQGNHAERRVVLEKLLDKTLHQFAKYFAMLDDKRQLDKFYLQQERVAQAWKYECQMHRPFFHPKPLKQVERSAWLHYLDSQQSGPFKTQLYRRLLIVGALDESLHLRYIRWNIAQGESPLQAFETADRQLPLDAVQVRLYYALWLEFTNQIPLAIEIYRRIGDAGAVQASAFAARNDAGGNPRSILVNAMQSTSLSSVEKVGVLRELVKYDPDAFQSFPLPECPEYWHAYLAARPDMGEHIYLNAPDGVITSEYLGLLARTQVAKYIELDRTINRRALGN